MNQNCEINLAWPCCILGLTRIPGVVLCFCFAIATVHLACDSDEKGFVSFAAFSA